MKHLGLFEDYEFHAVSIHPVDFVVVQGESNVAACLISRQAVDCTA